MAARTAPLTETSVRAAVPETPLREPGPYGRFDAVSLPPATHDRVTDLPGQHA
ncbi:hypothetical protein [Streptomyces sp. NPDC005485]|uniref:hypothetical protein n=1 Tax=Streptomyces sp. NPDC005485 TaxID=3155591 RepID=UPI0033BC61F0